MAESARRQQRRGIRHREASAPIVAGRQRFDGEVRTISTLRDIREKAVRFLRRRRFKPGVTAAIPTCGRPAKLRTCVQACLADGLVDRVLVWNSAPNPCRQLSRLAAEFPTLSVIEAGRLTGPGEARYQLARRVETEFLLFSDDSKYAEKGAVAEMMRLMRLHDDIDILCGAQRNANDGKWRDLAQNIEFGRLGEEVTVHKTFAWPQDLERLGLDAIASDIPNAQMLARSAVFEHVNFDPRYNFWFELFDFGMQCVAGGGGCECSPPIGQPSPMIPAATRTRT